MKHGLVHSQTVWVSVCVYVCWGGGIIPSTPLFTLPKRTHNLPHARQGSADSEVFKDRGVDLKTFEGVLKFLLPWGVGTSFITHTWHNWEVADILSSLIITFSFANLIDEK